MIGENAKEPLRRRPRAGTIACSAAMIKIKDTYALIALAVTAIICFYLGKRDIKMS